MAMPINPDWVGADFSVDLFDSDAYNQILGRDVKSLPGSPVYIDYNGNIQPAVAKVMEQFDKSSVLKIEDSLLAELKKALSLMQGESALAKVDETPLSRPIAYSPEHLD
jgi:hypothetical protein